MDILSQIEINDIKKLAVKAGYEILKYYKQDFEVLYKDDNSPVTTADLKANEIICDYLNKHYDIPILSEENETIDEEIKKNWKYYWCIDPLDGTRGFINKTDEFTVNIALVVLGEPVLGVVYAPCFNKLYYAQHNQGAYLDILDTYGNKLECYKLPRYQTEKNRHKIVISSSRMNEKMEEFIETKKKEFDVVEVHKIGSSLKLCMLAEGVYDSCPLFYEVSEWDVAATNCILKNSYIDLDNN